MNKQLEKLQSNKKSTIQTKAQQVKIQPDQIIKQQILQNLKKQSSFSHKHKLKSQLSQRNKSQINEPTTQRSVNNNSISNINSFNLQSARLQIQQLKSANNQFLNEQQINHKILINGYFSAIGKQINNKKQQTTAKKYSNRIENYLQDNIKLGVVRIAKHREDIKNLLVQFKLSAQQLKEMQKRANIQLKQHKFMLLDPFQQYKKSKLKTKQSHQNDKTKQYITHRQDHSSSYQNISINNFISKAVLSKQQHKKLIQKFKLSNKKNQRRHKQLLFQIQIKQKSLSNQRKKIEQENTKKQRQYRKLSIQQKLKKRKQQHQSFILQQKISTEKYKQMKKKKFLYQNMEEKYQSQILIPSLQQKKLKLKEIRDFQKKYDINQIKKHQLQYLEKKSQSSSKYNSRNKMITFHYNPPQRSKKLTQLLQEQKFRAKIKFQQKKRIAQQNKIRQINFISDIKINFKPKIDQKKRQQIQQRLKSEELQKSRSVQKDPKLLGMKYFEDAKKAMKKKNEKQKTQGQDIRIEDIDSVQRAKQKTQGSDFLPKSNYQNQFVKGLLPPNSNKKRKQKKINISLSQNSNHKINLHEQKRKQIRKIITSNDLQREVKLQRLKIENDRINQIYKRKQKFFRQHQDDQKTRQQAVGLLLNSIQAKMGIIDLCTKN